MVGGVSKRHLIALGALCLTYLAVFVAGYGWTSDGFFHRFFDQVSYRYEAAKVAESLETEGVAAGVACAWEHSTAQGLAYPLLGGVAYWTGIDPAQLMFAIFLAALVVVWWAMSSGGREPWLGWLSMALIGSTTTLLNKTGGPLDYRPDFLGQTLWTTATALALATRCFARRGPSIALGLVLGIAFCSRSLTFAYAAAAAPALVFAAWCGTPRCPGGWRRRLAHLGLAALIGSALAAPFFVARFDVLWDYYVTNHLSARENEARGFTDPGFWRHLEWYARSLRRNHVGWIAIGLMGATVWLTVARSTLPSLRRQWPLACVGLAFFSPLIVLSLGPQLSSTVSGVVAGTAVLMALLPALALGARPRRALIAVAVVGLAVWPARFLYKCAADRDERLAEGHQTARVVHDAILDETEGGRYVVVSTLPLIEAHSLAMLELVGYETRGRLPQRFGYGLGHEIYACPSEQAFVDRLSESRVVIWWDGGRSGGDLPANLEAEARRDVIVRVLAEQFRPASGPAHEQVFEGHPLRLYFHRDR